MTPRASRGKAQYPWTSELYGTRVRMVKTKERWLGLATARAKTARERALRFLGKVRVRRFLLRAKGKVRTRASLARAWTAKAKDRRAFTGSVIMSGRGATCVEIARP